ncbi:unnamed protein product (macronuclear) [Paramecium tetraurelia]|uniref:Casein kinase I n=1 Tax=Paramecium tetraurelia TaxID=5888 RepID=A0DD76_PARTE|nr:uncharacterized protein GSPATT00015852001 [Paramecium tetraurelia]CAK80993.1 unnamed protein product [Paramecium tetraurelia]|eukprot:XP_001448390.1 hypothetical protein (macronuclear) [Paramecium tetraurelia strain d4-2]
MSNYRYPNKLSQKSTEIRWVDKVICKNYRILNPINSGTFGHLYLAIHQVKLEYYAVKILQTGKSPILAQSVRQEAEVLYKLNGNVGFPRLYYFIQDGTNSFIVQTLLAQNLYQLLMQTPNKIFSLKTVLMFLDQAINRLEFLHKNDYIHRDIKPENFMTGLKEDEIYLIDFGFTQLYKDQGQHIEKQKNENMIGTPRFCPICTHLNQSQNRASDLESLGYLAIYFLKGLLPWMNIQAETKEEKIRLIGQKKMSTSIEELCYGLPKQFEEYFKYIQNIPFNGDPNYDYIQQLFKKLYQQMGYPFDQQFDWSSKLEVRNSDDNFETSKQQLFLEVGRKSFTADINIEELPSQIQKKNIERIHGFKISEDLLLITDLQQEEIQEFEPGLTLFEKMQYINQQQFKKQKNELKFYQIL